MGSISNSVESLEPELSSEEFDDSEPIDPVRFPSSWKPRSLIEETLQVPF